MNNAPADFKQDKLNDKVLFIISNLFSAIVAVLALIHLLGIWNYAIDIIVPLLGIIILIQAKLSWNTNKNKAIFSLCTAIFIFVSSIGIFSYMLFKSIMR